MNPARKLLCACCVLLSAIHLTQAQQIIKDSTLQYQFILPGDYKKQEPSARASQVLFIDDNGSSVLVKFDRTSEPESQIASELVPETLEQNLSGVINAFKKIAIYPSTVDDINATTVHYNYVHADNTRQIELTMITKMYYRKGHIVNISCTAPKEIFTNYKKQFDVVLNSFTHDLDKDIDMDYFDNGVMFLPATGISIRFPEAPIKNTSPDMVSYETVDSTTNIEYSLQVLPDDNFIGAEPARTEYKAEWLAAYKKSMQEGGNKISDTTFSGHQGIYFSYYDKKTMGDNRHRSLMTINGHSALILTVKGDKYSLDEAFKQFVGSIKTLE
jgi:hypothetical protein